MKQSIRTFALIGAVGVCGLLAAGCASKAQRLAQYQASAKSYMAEQSYPEAIIQYRNALQLNPNSAELEYDLGQAYTRNEQYQSAFYAFNRALSLKPDYQKAQLAVAEFYLVARQWPKAIAAANADLAKHPGDPDAAILLANVAAAQGNAADAVQQLQALVQRVPKYIPARLSLGILYATQRQPQLAQQQFEQAIALDPHSVAARNDMAGLFAAQGNAAGAEAAYRANVAANPKSVSALQAYANYLFLQRRFADAEPLYRKLVDLQHNSAPARFALASFYAAEGKPEQALAIDQSLAKQAPSFTQAREQWAQIELQGKHLKQATDVLNSLIKDEPNDVDALVMLAGIQLQQRQTPQALNTLAAAQRLDPNLSTVAFEQGQAYVQENQLDRAEDSFQQAVRLDGKNYNAQSAMAELLLNKGDSQSALSYAKTMQTLAPARPEGYFFAGSALANLGQFAAAEAAFQRYIALNPKSPLGPDHLGYVYLAQRRFPDAQRAFAQALQLDPTDANAVTGEATLLQATGKTAKLVPSLQAALAAATAAHAQPAQLAVINDNLARAYVETKQNGLAEAALRTSLRQDPHNFNTYVLLGTLYAQENAFPQAWVQFTKAAQNNPQSAGLWTLLGMLDEQLNHRDEAVAAYQHAIAIDPNNGVADNNLASIYTDEGKNLNQALVLAQRAKRALPSIANVNDTLGWVYVQENVYQMAIPLLQQAVASQPKTADFRLHLGTALYRAGQKQAGRAQLLEAIKLDQSLAKQGGVQQMLRN